MDSHITINTSFYTTPNFFLTNMTPAAYRLLTTANAGGNSIISEAMSVEFLIKAFTNGNYTNKIITEMEIDYIVNDWKPCDYMIHINKILIAVSVTRAMSHYNPNNYTLDMANKLLIKKLNGLVLARTGVHKHHYFTKSILHVWCQTEQIVKLINQAFDDLDPDYKNGIALICTVTNMARIYTNY